MKSWLEQNDIGMYSIHNEIKSVAAEDFITSFKNKIYKYMTSISKILYINKLVDIVTKYNTAYHDTITMKHADVKSSTYIDFDKKNNKHGPKFKVADYVRTLKYKNILVNVYFSNWSEQFFVIKKIENIVPCSNVINDLNGEVIVGTFYEKELEKKVK